MKTHPNEEIAVARRKILKATAILGGAVALGHLPYAKPEIRSFFGVRNAYAFQSSPTTIVVSGNLGTLAPGSAEDTGQDVFQFAVQAGSTLTIQVVVDANLWPEIGLFEPGVTTSGTNLLTGSSSGLASPSQGVGLTTAPLTVTPAGAYSLAIEDNAGNTSEFAGTYSMTVNSDLPLGAPTQILDEGPETLLEGK